MEIADIFVVNKSDREGARRMISELDMILDIRRKKGKWEYPIVSTEAMNNKGIDLLFAKISEHRDFITDNGVLEQHRKNQIKVDLRKIIELKVKELIDEKILSSFNIEEIAEKVYKGEDDPYSAGERVLNKINLDK